MDADGFPALGNGKRCFLSALNLSGFLAKGSKKKEIKPRASSAEPQPARESEPGRVDGVFGTMPYHRGT